MPLENESVDSIIITFTLCTIPNLDVALQQIYRLLKPNGKLYFCEHGLDPNAKVQQWQNCFTPLWKK
ncbi:methyltransferase domain-containing protein [Plesiomonas shigelloides]|uniref:class I SAM-dependent methyltransferase n=1 Tax=Plesiomonas shigelloides TaxID=703 RepID=UPI001C49C3C4